MFDKETRARFVELGRKLRQRREDRNLTHQALSDASTVHTSYLGRIERGERRPSADILRKIAEPLGFTEIELLKMAGYLSLDQVDDRIARFKKSMKAEVEVAMGNLKDKVDIL